MTNYVIMEPDEWGMTWDAGPYVEVVGDDTEIYVHHSAGNPFHHLPAAEAFRTMNRYAKDGKGYAAVGYDIMVHEHPATDTVTIGVARGQYRSAATRDRNEIGEAVCALGYFHPGHKLSARPSERMRQGIAIATAELVRRGWTVPQAKLLGHRDNPAHPLDTGCPGDWLYPYMGELRTLHALQLTSPPPPTKEEHQMMTVRFVDEATGTEYADEYVCVPISSLEDRRKTLGPNARPAMLAVANIDEVAQRAGYGQTPV